MSRSKRKNPQRPTIGTTALTRGGLLTIRSGVALDAHALALQRTRLNGYTDRCTDMYADTMTATGVVARLVDHARKLDAVGLSGATLALTRYNASCSGDVRATRNVAIEHRAEYAFGFGRIPTAGSATLEVRYDVVPGAGTAIATTSPNTDYDLGIDLAPALRLADDLLQAIDEWVRANPVPATQTWQSRKNS